VSIWLFYSGVTDALGLATVNITKHGWVFAAWPTQADLVIIDSNYENWIDSTSAAVGVGSLEEVLI
jgi:hypothetical protein